MLRLGALGDVADTGPAVLALREQAPQARVTWLTKAAFAPLVRQWCDDVIALPGGASQWPGFLKRLCGTRWDLCLDFHANIRSGLLCFLSGSPVTVGYGSRLCKEGSENFYTHHVHVDENCRSRLDQGLALVEALGARADYRPPALARDAADETLADQTMAGGHDIVLVAGMSPRGRFKAWPAERWRRLLEISGDRKFLMVWGPGERDAVAGIARGFGDRVRLAPRTSLSGLVAILDRARAVVGADTGPMHLAHLLGRPTLVLFGPKDPDHYGPQYNEHRILWNRQVCAPCRNWRCDHVSCMWSLGADQVHGAMESLLRSES